MSRKWWREALADNTNTDNEVYLAFRKEDIELAYDRWCAVIGENEYKSFWKFINTDPVESMRSWVGSYRVNTKGVDRLKHLLSDNHISIIKTYQAREMGMSKFKAGGKRVRRQKALRRKAKTRRKARKLQEQLESKPDDQTS